MSAPLARRLERGDALTGVLVKMPQPAVVELAGHAGIDVILLDTEHGIGDAATLEHHLRAADAVGVPALVRVPGPAAADVQRALDGGAQGIVVPMVSSVEVAQQAVAAAFYPPLGARGLALTTRAGGHGLGDGAAHLERAARETVLLVQIEDAQGVENAEAIAALPQVAGVLIGPNDLAMSLGHGARSDHPDVQRQVDRVVAAFAAAGKAVCAVASSTSEAIAWRRRGAGVTFLAATTLLGRALRTTVATLRDVDGAPTPIRRLDHIAVAVQDTDRALAHFRDHLGLTVIHDERLEQPPVRLTYLDAGNAFVQLVQPLRDDTPLAQLIATEGEGLHHLCWGVDDPAAAAAELATTGETVPPGQGRGRVSVFVGGPVVHGVRMECTRFDREADVDGIAGWLPPRATNDEETK